MMTVTRQAMNPLGIPANCGHTFPCFHPDILSDSAHDNACVHRVTTSEYLGAGAAT